MTIEVKHSLSKDEAKARVTGLISQLRQQFGGQITELNEQWSGYTDKFQGSAKGYSLSGAVEVRDAAVQVDLKLPFLMRVFSGKIKSVVEDYLTRELKP